MATWLDGYDTEASLAMNIGIRAMQTCNNIVRLPPFVYYVFISDVSGSRA